jgi:hypothetical protein
MLEERQLVRARETEGASLKAEVCSPDKDNVGLLATARPMTVLDPGVFPEFANAEFA